MKTEILTKEQILSKFEELTADDDFLFKLISKFIQNSYDKDPDYLVQYYISLYLQLKPNEPKPNDNNKEE
jgi:hypothetical protein